jgi:hypothetical protein
MTELTNPLFEEEKEFLERKKLEYERALLGDVEHLKDQSVIVGKVALIGAGLAGGIWLLTKAFGSKKKKRRFEGPESANPTDQQEDEAEYYTAGNGKRYKSKKFAHSAKESAAAFLAADAASAASFGETDDLGFGSSAPHQAEATRFSEEDPFQELPYDDSRRLPASHAFDEEPTDDYEVLPASRSHVITSLLASFLQSDTGKVLVAQAAAVALALVTKKINEFFPADKNADLATSPGYAAAETGFSPVATSDSSAPDASFYPQQSV